MSPPQPWSCSTTNTTEQHDHTTPSERYAEWLTVYLEQAAGRCFLDRPEEVDPYNETFDDLRDRALDERSSAELVEQALRRFDQQ
jgi:hypothetical protein